MTNVKIGIVGIGNMGSAHAKNLFDGKVKNAELATVCDVKQSRLDWAKESFGDSIKTYDSFDKIVADSDLDALLIATPHYDHPIMGKKTLEADKHVLVEKPIGVYTKAVRELNEAAAKSDKVFTVMYNQRSNPVYQKVKDMIESGELGDIRRVNWVITDWFRTQYYFNSGGWRATWEGEGGGVLLNQCPHNIDLVQWMCGMPKRVRAFCKYGQYHDIEVEDDVTAYFEYENGATGVFITSTGEAPGTNRLEISADKGKLVVERSGITFYRNREKTSEFLVKSDNGFAKPENWECKIPAGSIENEHVRILQYFTDGILKGEKQLSPGVEGINGLTLSNAIHLSSWTDDWVDIPFDEDKFYNILQEKIKNSTVKKSGEDVVMNVEGSH